MGATLVVARMPRAIAYERFLYRHTDESRYPVTEGVVSLRMISLSQTLDSGFRRSDAVVSSYAIALPRQALVILLLP